MNKSNYLETILTGEHAGEKGLFVEEKLCWTDSKTDFFEQRELTGDEYEKNQIYVRDGQQIFREHLNCERKLVICGAGHVSIPIIKNRKNVRFSCYSAGRPAAICQPCEKRWRRYCNL